MTEVDLHGERVDKCEQCSGLFFDKGELGSIVHLIELYQKVPVSEDDIDSVPIEEHRRIVRCPDDSKPMDPKDIAGLTIDVCPECQGIWLDSGEITALKIAENHIKQNLQLYIRLGE
jgi:Zn-finger nucleic acid-binding protein